MRKLKVMLSAFALLLAIGGTFATQIHASYLDHNQYEFIDRVGEDDDECKHLATTVCGFGPTPCTVNGNKVGNSSQISSGCGTQLNMQ